MTILDRISKALLVLYRWFMTKCTQNLCVGADLCFRNELIACELIKGLHFLKI